MKLKCYFSTCMVAVAAALVTAPAAHAAWPEQPVRLIVPYAAGGGADNVARVVAERIGNHLGQTVVVENRPGAGGAVAEGAVARSKADGYTVLYDTFAFAVNASLRKLSFNPEKDLTPVALVATSPMALVVNPKVPANNLSEFMELAKSKQGGLSYASFGLGSSAHLASEMLARAANVEMLHVPYKGGAPALVDVVGGQVDAYFANVSSGLNYIKGGQLRALAVSSLKRAQSLPEVPTVAESGYADFEVLDWHGIFLPTGTPDDIRKKLTEAVEFAVQDAGVVARLQEWGIDPSTMPAADFPAFIQGQMTHWSSLIKELNISLE